MSLSQMRATVIKHIAVQCCTHLVSLGWFEHRSTVLVVADVGIVLVPLQGDVPHSVPDLLQGEGREGEERRRGRGQEVCTYT